jgi:hypothetical protein
MYSSHHATLSVLAGVALLPFVSTGLGPVGLVAYAVVLGVGVDFDHFLIARYNAGDWATLRACLANPRRVFFSQDELFEPGEVGVLQRLLTHVVLGGVVVTVLLAGGLVDLAVVSAVVLYVHVLADLVWDVAR